MQETPPLVNGTTFYYSEKVHVGTQTDIDKVISTVYRSPYMELRVRLEVLKLFTIRVYRCRKFYT